MPELQARRRLVKSPPELWAEVSDAASLARHLGDVGEIRITRLTPETEVAWEGERASGTVELAPAGWGTAVTLTAAPATVAVEPPAPAAEPEPEPEPAAEPEPEPEVAAPPPSRFAALVARLRRRPPEPVAAEPAAAEPAPAPEAEPAGDPLLASLTAALDSLGAAHHRPFSRG